MISLLSFGLAAKSKAPSRISIGTDNLTLTMCADASDAYYILKDNPDASHPGTDFWRLILDDGLRVEMPVRSSRQKGTAICKDGVLTVTYDELVNDDGNVFPVRLVIKVVKEGELLKFSPYIENNTQNVRVNECFCPIVDVAKLYGEPSKDALYWPTGLGRKVMNPIGALERAGLSGANTTGLRDNEESAMHLVYPRASMGWFGIQSGDKFLYTAAADKDMHLCFLSVRHRIGDGKNVMTTIDHMPLLRPGDKIQVPDAVCGLFDGDWRKGADIYRAWADKNFFKVTEGKKWMQDMAGWMRITPRAQNGTVRYEFKELPRLYEEARACGLNGLFMFAWWKEGMDRGYPDYHEPYPGAFDELAESVKKIEEMGGHFILVCNAHFVDPTSDFYQKHGKEVELLDSYGNTARRIYAYCGLGEFHSAYGAPQFNVACFGSETWRKQVLSQLRFMGDRLGVDCVFADCVGGCPSEPCFNTAHDHGYHPDGIWTYGQRQFFDEALKYAMDNGKVFGTEVVTDIAASKTHFIHGLVTADFRVRSDYFPALFRYTYPEVITSLRKIQDSQDDFASRFKYALTQGLRMDACLYGCRRSIADDPKYCEVVKFYTGKLNEWGKYFYHGRYTVIDNSELPWYVKRGEFLSPDGKTVLRVLFNASSKTVKACGTTIEGLGMEFREFPIDEYPVSK